MYPFHWATILRLDVNFRHSNGEETTERLDVQLTATTEKSDKYIECTLGYLTDAFWVSRDRMTPQMRNRQIAKKIEALTEDVKVEVQLMKPNGEYMLQE